MMLTFLKRVADNVMAISLIKLSGLLKASARWFYTFVTDQTKIGICGKHSNNTQKKDALLVENDSTDMGMLVFGMTTSSRHSIEILKFVIDYAMPLQLLDPRKMGFFQAEGSGDESFPVRIFSDQRF